MCFRNLKLKLVYWFAFLFCYNILLIDLFLVSYIQDETKFNNILKLT
jgi:hypothetical protein